MSSQITHNPKAFDLSSLTEWVSLLHSKSLKYLRNPLRRPPSEYWCIHSSRQNTVKSHNPKAPAQGRPPWTIITLTSLISPSLENMIKKWPGHTASAPGIWLVFPAACQSSWEVQICNDSWPRPIRMTGESHSICCTLSGPSRNSQIAQSYRCVLMKTQLYTFDYTSGDRLKSAATDQFLFNSILFI